MGVLSSDRLSNGYRTFLPDDVRRVRLIRQFLSVGFTLEEIRLYAPCWQTDLKPSDPVPVDVAADFYRRKLAAIDVQLRDLQIIRDRLTAQLSDLDHAGATGISPHQETP